MRPILGRERLVHAPSRAAISRAAAVAACHQRPSSTGSAWRRGQGIKCLPPLQQAQSAHLRKGRSAASILSLNCLPATSRTSLICRTGGTDGTGVVTHDFVLAAAAQRGKQSDRPRQLAVAAAAADAPARLWGMLLPAAPPVPLRRCTAGCSWQRLQRWLRRHPQTWRQHTPASGHKLGT